MKCITVLGFITLCRQTELSLDHWNVGFGVLWGFMSGTSVPLWLCLDCAVQQTENLPTHRRNTGLKGLSRRYLSNGFTTWQCCVLSGLSRASSNRPWAALPNSASGPAAGNWIWVLWSRGVVKAAEDAGLAGLWTLDDHLCLDPACSGWATSAGSGQIIAFLKLLMVAMAQHLLAWDH